LSIAFSVLIKAKRVDLSHRLRWSVRPITSPVIRVLPRLKLESFKNDGIAIVLNEFEKDGTGLKEARDYSG
jgi:hypothetical protein